MEDVKKELDKLKDHDLLITVASEVRHIKDSLDNFRLEAKLRHDSCRRDLATKVQLNGTNAAVKWLYSIVATLFAGTVLWIIKT